MNILRKISFTLVFVSLFLFSTQLPADENEDRAKLLEQEKALKEKIESLKREQDFLLFEKTLSANDSKYLVLHLKEEKGELRYKGRVLRNFSFTPLRKQDHRRIAQGAITLTKKVDSPQRTPAALAFDKTLIIQKKSSASTSNANTIPRISLHKKDFIAIYYAVDLGAKAYLFRD